MKFFKENPEFKYKCSSIEYDSSGLSSDKRIGFITVDNETSEDLLAYGNYAGNLYITYEYKNNQITIKDIELNRIE